MRVALALSLAAAPVLAVPAPPPRPDLILYTAGPLELRTVDAATGKSEKAAGDGKSVYHCPAYDPTGKKIVYGSMRVGVQNLYVADADGGNAKVLFETADNCRAPAWSPDGKKVAFIRTVPGNQPRIAVADADGSNAVNLTDGLSYDADPAWSPDGKKIAFVSDRKKDGFRLHVMDADGANAVDLAAKGNTQGFAYPAWSPDGKWIALADQVDRARSASLLEICLVSPDGKERKQLTTLGGTSTFPAWSRDSKRIAFVAFVGGKAPLYVVDADGKNLKALVEDAKIPGENGRASWKP